MVRFVKCRLARWGRARHHAPVTLQRILIVGCGNMGRAMLAGWLRAGVDPARFTVVDPALAEAPGGVELLHQSPAARFDAIVLGIKPQAFAAVAPSLAAASEGAVVLSLLAGVELRTLAARLPGAAAHVRVMAHLGAARGKSPIALAGGGPRADIETLMASLGPVEWVAETQMDLLTALVGSGPGFVYRFVAALAKGATELGLDAVQAERLALAMCEGATELAAAADESPAELARRVASPGGTTEAGLAVLDADAALERLIVATLRAARDRGAELASGSRG